MKRLFTGFRDLKIAYKLFLLIVVINVATSSVGGLLLTVYTRQMLRNEVVAALQMRTEIVAAANLSTALSFMDKKAAQDALVALTRDENTVAAAVFDKFGNVFSAYPRFTEDLKNSQPRLHQDYWFNTGELFIKRQVLLGNENVGSLVLQYSLQGIQRKFWYSVLAIAGFMSGATVLTCLLASLLQSQITRPIRALTALTLQIVQKADYSVRAEPHGHDEIGELTQHINNMLEQIEARDATLEQYNKELEKMVAKRTEQLERINRNLEHLTRHDALTELPNRILFMDRLQQAIFSADRNRTKAGILFVDLDYFKQINDTYGHEVGDQVLLQVAGRLQSCVRSVDTVCRFAGDEFILLLPNIKCVQDLSSIAVKVTRKLAEPLLYKALSLDVAASIGGAVYPDDAEDTELLMQAADVAMYHAKKRGKNRFELFSDGLNDFVLKRQQMQLDLKKAVANNEFVILYQPVIDLASGRIDSLESLLRWRHPQLGLLAPENFLAVAKESGLITEIDKLMVFKVAEQLKKWHVRGYATTVRINLAMRDFLCNDFFELFFRLLESSDIAPHMLSVEIEECVLRNETPQITRSLNRLKESPVSISIDNFGTEYASLVTLMRGRIQYVKIDRSYFQRNVLNGEPLRLIQALIVAMAHSLNVKVIAAGVETKSQHAFLEKIGCDLAQGYLFHRPMFSEQVEELLANAGISV
ncbi:MAG: EAL domain-containing protein [Gammaproteobacteria bacterium]